MFSESSPGSVGAIPSESVILESCLGSAADATASPTITYSCGHEQARGQWHYGDHRAGSGLGRQMSPMAPWATQSVSTCIPSMALQTAPMSARLAAMATCSDPGPARPSANQLADLAYGGRTGGEETLWPRPDLRSRRSVVQAGAAPFRSPTYGEVSRSAQSMPGDRRDLRLADNSFTK
jgi:hypothetical protein